jgi:UDP-N-acetyl-D-glucosamine dehydrogenase
VLIVGVAYKKNVTDMRESPSMRIMANLHPQEVNVDYLDPHVPVVPKMRDFPQFESKRSVKAGDISAAAFDAIIIATDHDNIDYAALAELGVPIIDTRNVFARLGLPMDNVTKA